MLQAKGCPYVKYGELQLPSALFGIIIIVVVAAAAAAVNTRKILEPSCMERISLTLSQP
jgi:hypothetical protein